MSVPAWKRIGLEVKKDLEEDPLAITTHLESATVTNKQAKRLNKQKRKLEAGEKKPPKRVKLPKSERGPPPERDQLAYLRQYHEDKDQWKFSKQKQNWILRNIRTIPQEYERALVAYLEGLQGGSRDRVAEEMREVVNKWNVLAAELEKKVERKLAGEAEVDDEAKAEAKEEKEEEKVDHDYAVRCRKILHALTEEQVDLKGIEGEEESKEEKVQPESDEAEKESQKEDQSESEEKEEDVLILEDVEVGYVEEGQDVIQTKEEAKPEKAKKKDKKKDRKKAKAKATATAEAI